MDLKKTTFTNLILKLHHDKMTGVVTVKDNRSALKIYLKSGHVIYADGIDKESQLLKEIAAKRRLNRGQMDELIDIKEKDPQSLGATLIERKLISRSVWARFLELKVKRILAIAFHMKAADLGFSQSQLNIPPINFIDFNIIQFLLDTIRGIKKEDHFEEYTLEDNAIFSLSEEAMELKDNIPLIPSEQTIFYMVDGQKSVAEIIKATGLEQENVYKGFYLLICFGLIALVPEDEKKKGDGADHTEIIHLYIDLLGIIKANFQREVGKEFENIFSQCRDELTGQSAELFHDMNLSTDNQETIVEEISRRFARKNRTVEERLPLLTSFNKLVYLLIMRMKKVLGLGLTEKTLEEMMNMLEYVEKYRQDIEMMHYVTGNLKDYLQQVRS